MAARDAGIRVITVLGGQCEERELLCYSPDYVVASIDEIEKIISSEPRN
jgi:phosphoglycolate phosphatase-like HAD superfamily hydrolase